MLKLKICSTFHDGQQRCCLSFADQPLRTNCAKVMHVISQYESQMLIIHFTESHESLQVLCVHLKLQMSFHSRLYLNQMSMGYFFTTDTALSTACLDNVNGNIKSQVSREKHRQKNMLLKGKVLAKMFNKVSL